MHGWQKREICYQYGIMYMTYVICHSKATSVIIFIYHITHMNCCVLCIYRITVCNIALWLALLCFCIVFNVPDTYIWNIHIIAEIFTMSYTHGFQMSTDTSVCPLESSPNAWDSSPLWLSCVYTLRKIFYIHIIIVHDNTRRKRLKYNSSLYWVRKQMLKWAYAID